MKFALAFAALVGLSQSKQTLKEHALLQSQTTDEQVDLAVGGITSGGSTWANMNIWDAPVKGGGKSGSWPGTCYHSNADKTAHWAVEFGWSQINEIRITNRADCCSGRLHDVDILVDGMVVDTIVDAPGAGAVHVVQLPEGTIGHSVTIGFNSNRNNVEPYLQLCGVEVLGSRYDLGWEPIDLAIGQETDGSSTWSGLDIWNAPVSVEDKGAMWPGTCYHSVADQSAWWSVQVGESYIDHIVITNRADCCHTRLQEFEVLIDGVVCYQQAEAALGGERIYIDSCYGEGSSVEVRYSDARSSWEPYLTLCGVEVWGEVAQAQNDEQQCEIVDVAPQASIQTSSTYQNLNIAYSPVQGQASSWPGNCWHSTSDVNAYYQLQLDSEYQINDIIITNRKDCCSQRLNNFEVLVDGVQCYNQVEAATAGEDIQISSCAQKGSSVEIKYNDNRNADQPYLTLCGVQIFAEIGCEEQNDTYGEEIVTASDFPGECHRVQTGDEVQSAQSIQLEAVNEEEEYQPIPQEEEFPRGGGEFGDNPNN